MSQIWNQHEAIPSRVMAEVTSLVYSSALKIETTSSFETTVDFQPTLYPRRQTELFTTKIHRIRLDSSINHGVFTLRHLYAIMNASEFQELFYRLYIATCRPISKKRVDKHVSAEIQFLEANSLWVLTNVSYDTQMKNADSWRQHVAVESTGFSV
jgi:hypothetical protein